MRTKTQKQFLREETFWNHYKLHQDRYQMENMLECAIIVLWLQLGWLSGEDQVEQSPQTLRVQEGDNVSLTCSYTVSTFRGLQWYRQDPGEGPEHLFLLYSVGKGQQKGRLSVSLSQKESSLHITTPKAEDSATYLCAVEPQCSPGTCSLYQNPAAGALE
ncbi:T-cell receptor alpha chain V region CTL-L17 [Myotis brandtii]|nr:T-cell receptor alpha chain V region CTL-L17 [Myotis brandtii]